MRGLGVMINDSMNNPSADMTPYYGKVIVSIEIKREKSLVIMFDDGSGIKLSDRGQSCCEHRYMSTDDDLSLCVGSKFLGAKITGDGSLPSDEYHDTQFLDVLTSDGVVTFVNHNEHNGYYGGFSIIMEEIKQ